VFTIGAFARLCGVSAKALRAYDSLGLFRPVWVDRATAYRYYSAAQLPELRRILGLRELGIGLAEIKGLVVGRADLGAALDRRRAELQRERDLIDRRLAALDIRIDMALEAGSGVEPSAVVVRAAAPELVATLPLAIVPDEEAETGFDELEAHIRDLRRRAHGPPGALVTEAASEHEAAVELFVPLTRPILATGRIGSRRLPAATLATVIVRGGYHRLPAARTALEGWVMRTGHRRAGELRIIYLQFGAAPELALPRGYVVDDPADYVTELQLPIEPSG
jgi:DNA-binding transcriptional MerR regulator